ncbi:unnamed protein product [Dibothriocephalus latus]|uniref:Reverse transcriptase domain-containing protein n=1 Tax=Dibothriocephalus latus TaxID=60516 RepID=A0A3P7Q506_DIBLA|nr:unnamed protein product [Dibothriocephalus latus]
MRGGRDNATLSQDSNYFCTLHSAPFQVDCDPVVSRASKRISHMRDAAFQTYLSILKSNLQLKIMDEALPDDWASGILIPVYKKGDKTRCTNYRGKSLIDFVAKIFVSVFLRRFQSVRDSSWPNQA